MKRKKKYPKLKTDERPRHENWCKENEADPDGFPLWDSPVYKGYISPGEYAMGLRKTWQTRKEAER